MRGIVLCQVNRAPFEKLHRELMQLKPSRECLEQFALEQLKNALVIGISPDELGILWYRLTCMAGDEMVVFKAYYEAINFARKEKELTKADPPRSQTRPFTVARWEIPVEAKV